CNGKPSAAGQANQALGISANQSREKSILETGLVRLGRGRFGRSQIADVIVLVDVDIIGRRYVDGLVLVRRYVWLWLRLFLDGVFVLLGGHGIPRLNLARRPSKHHAARWTGI